MSGHSYSRHSYSSRSTGGGEGSVASTIVTADAYLQYREPAWFRTRLTLRLAVPLDPPARVAAWRLAVSAALLAPPVMVLLIAPASRLTGRTLIALCCIGLPGAAALLWSAAVLREDRSRTARGLRRAGGEDGIAWLIAASRLVSFTAIGAVCGVLCVVLLHAPLGDLLPRRTPLHGMFGAGLVTWILGAVQTLALAIAAALIASAPAWRRRKRRRKQGRRQRLPSDHQTAPDGSG